MEKNKISSFSHDREQMKKANEEMENNRNDNVLAKIFNKIISRKC